MVVVVVVFCFVVGFGFFVLFCFLNRLLGLFGNLKPVLPLSAALVFPHFRPKRKALPYLKHTNAEEVTGLFQEGEPEPRRVLSQAVGEWKRRLMVFRDVHLECTLEMCVCT